MKLIITGDESWAYGYDPETKHQSSQWKNPVLLGQRKHGRCDQIHGDCVFRCICEQGQTVNKEFYLDVMRRLREAVHRKRLVLWLSSRWMLHHGGTPAHTTNLVQKFLTKHGAIQVSRPPYSPDMSPSDFFLFPKIKNTSKGHRFQDIETMKLNSTQQLQAISKSEFQKCFEDWNHRWAKCVTANGAYFEGD
ncbi:mariner Mos1 transposase [Trichonephila clavipes]|nr:mariner Mos1 transposase [Trichonephila clavipes]